jgi:hypothetical protein
LLTLAGQLPEGGEGVLHAETQAGGGQAGLLQVALDELGVAAGFLDAQGGRGAAAQAFQAQRARAGKQFQHPRPLHARAKAVEDGLPHQVGRGPHLEAFGRLSTSTPPALPPMMRIAKLSEPFASAVAGFQIVPEFDVLLVLFPAQKNFPAVAQGGEIQQAAAEVLDLNLPPAELLQRFAGIAPGS